MKRTVTLFTIIISLVFVSNLYAAESVSISLEQPKNISRAACPVPLWNDEKIVWDGVKDMRESAEIGLQTKKGKEPIDILADPLLTEVMDKALQNFLKTCGLNLVKDNTSPHLSAKIVDFYAGVNKKILTGSTTAKSVITLTKKIGYGTSDITMNCEIESKGMRSGKLKKITETLNNLLLETLVTIANTQPIIDMMKEKK
ncbi:MAG: YajG family lipoprotein [Pseudomonadota bacterium]